MRESNTERSLNNNTHPFRSLDSCVCGFSIKVGSLVVSFKFISVLLHSSFGKSRSTMKCIFVGGEGKSKKCSKGKHIGSSVIRSLHLVYKNINSFM